MRGERCPKCRGFAVHEPGGARCLNCGATYLLRRILPRDHPLSGYDRANRVRQRALDRMLLEPGRAREIVQEMLEDLEWRPGARVPGDPVPA